MGPAANAPEAPLRWRRVLLKLSGEAFARSTAGRADGAGTRDGALDYDAIRTIGLEIAHGRRAGVEIAVVVGAGNIIRGERAAEAGMDRAAADYMGMLGTVINSMALQDALEKLEVQTRVLSAISMAQVAEPFIRRRATRHLEKGRVIVLAGGSGNPFFTTDTAAALRATEIRAGAVLKATNVDGVFDKDPHKFPDARMYEHLTFDECIRHNLRVMDQTAFTFCKEHNLPIVVFNIGRPEHIRRAVMGEPIGTLIEGT